ncbi:MAG: heme A synthase [Candidatus Thioglobus sp.]|nr:MAG: heme A synthase [Candidatus Thioglobus sp.]KAA0454654.1 MAG: heme A synthase [Candidatus Thioglobus sp.]
MFKKLLRISIILALVVVVLGAYTRLSDAGLGCPDWPTCYGHLTVPDAPEGSKVNGFERPLEAVKGWKEMVHRYSASLLGLMIFVLFFLVFSGKTKHQQPSALPAFIAFFVLLQGAFGMWTVTLLVHPGIVTIHLIGGFSTTALLVWLLLNQRRPPIIHKHILKKHRQLIVATLLVLTAQIILGGWTSTNYAALSCGENFPTCLGAWWPQMDLAGALYWGPIGTNYEYGVLPEAARVGVQMLHRIGALVATLTVVTLIYMFRHYQHMRSNLMIIAALLCLQVALGVANVLFSIPMAVALAHNAVALLLFISVLVLLHKATPKTNLNFAIPVSPQ